MPKVVSQSVVSSSENDGPTQQQLHVYYCTCSEFLLVIDANLKKLPKRKTDGSVIVSNARRVYKLTADKGETLYIKREQGYEKQYRLTCPRCRQVIGYETTPKLKAGYYTYLIDGALKETQSSK